MTNTRNLLLPAIAIVAGGLAATVFIASGSSHPDSSPSVQVPSANASAATAKAPAGPTAPEGQRLSGLVLERIAVQKYTYLRIGEEGTEGTWAAVSACEAKVGERVSVSNAQRMTDFQSPTLKRTFSTIYFGELDGPNSNAAVEHASADVTGDTADPHAGLPSGDNGAAIDPGSLPSHHMVPQQLADPVEVGKLEKASGPLGRSVAQIYAERAKLGGQKVRVRGVVVKVVANVLDRTFIHLRDGTGNAGDNTHDLTVTASAAPKVGDKLLYEGTLTIDKDYGSGYRYQAVLENATVVPE
jgi:hypothetical protein